jgi:hypothetical protein
MDTYADDLAVIEALDLKDAVLRAIPPAGAKWPAISAAMARPAGKAVLVGAVTPVMKAGPTNPDGLPQEVFDGIRKAVLDNRSGFYLAFPDVFFGWDIGVPRTKACAMLSGSRACRAARGRNICACSSFRKRISPPILPPRCAHADRARRCRSCGADRHYRPPRGETGARCQPAGV